MDRVAAGWDRAGRLLYAQPRVRRRTQPHPIIEKLRRLRLAEGISQAEFAARLGYPATTVCSYETGQMVPRGLRLLMDWSELLGVEVILVWRKEGRATLPDEL